MRHQAEADLFFLLHGDHPVLSAGEVRAILEAGGFSYKVKGVLPQVLRCRVNRACIPVISQRAYMTRLCAEELLICHDEPTEIFRGLEGALSSGRMEMGDSFSVSLRRVRRSAQDIDLKALRRQVAGLISSRTGAELNFERPRTRFIGLFSGGRFLFGRILSEVSSKRLSDRRPSRRPFFHPTALHPKLAGCMVNLTRASPGDLLLDPFCGSGSILIEADLLGCKVLGSDIQPLMVRGSRMNLIHYGVRDFHLLLADARKPPFAEVDAIATDPPYGRSATTMGVPTKSLLEDFLHSAAEVLKYGGYLCTASPTELSLADLGRGAGLKVVESYIIPVHGSLTRELVVFRRG